MRASAGTKDVQDAKTNVDLPVKSVEEIYEEVDDIVATDYETAFVAGAFSNLAYEAPQDVRYKALGELDRTSAYTLPRRS